MAFFDYSPAITAAALIAQDPNQQAQLWDRIFMGWEENEDFFAQFEGAGEDSLIITRTDTAKGAGQYIHFRVAAGFYRAPHQGDQLFESPTDFEPLKADTYPLQVDTIRHGTSYNERTEEFLGIRGELTAGLPKREGQWLGRLKSEQMMMMYRELLPSSNKYIVNNQPSTDSLASTDGLAFNPIVALKATAAEQGGQPANLDKDSQGNAILGYALIATTTALYSLETDTNFVGALKTTRDEAAAKTLFEGGWTMVRGIGIKEYRAIDHDGWGPIGSPFNPKALLGAAVSSSSTAITFIGGGDAVSAAQPVDYFRYFHNYAYPFQLGNVLTQDSSTHYFIVVNPSNSPAGYLSGGIGMYSYTTGNTGFSILTNAQLGPANNGYQVTSLGSVTWNTGVWAGLHTTSHPIGSTIYQCNAKGQPTGDSILLARGSAFRGYGKDRNKRQEQLLEGGFVKQIFIQSIFGQVPRQDTRGRTPAAFRLRHALAYTNTSIPANIL